MDIVADDNDPVVDVAVPSPGSEADVLVTRLCLTLANTQYLQRGAVTDRLATAADLKDWIASVRRLLSTELPDVDLAGTSDSDVLAVADLRRAIRSMAAAVITDLPLDPEDVTVLNRRLALVPRWTELVVGEHGVGTRSRSTASAVPAAIAEVAADAVALFADPRARQALAACGGPACLNLFLRAWSDQQWCSARCANRLIAVREDAVARGRHT